MWCGDEACEIRMKEEAGMTSRCIPFAQQHLADTCAICGKHAVAGRSISHSHRVTNRKFRPNIQHVTCVVDGHKKKLNVCSTCLKSGKVARS